MLDSDNAMLLRPVGPNSGFALEVRQSNEASGDRNSTSVITAMVHYLEPGAADAFVAFFEAVLAPRVVAAGGSILAVLATENRPNTFARLPVRDGEQVLVSFSAFTGPAAIERHRHALKQLGGWRESAPAHILRQVMRKPEVLVLEPTRRSLLR